MTEDKPIFGLKERFDISKLEKRLIGRIVSVRGQGADFSLMGKLTYYAQGEIAVLQPYVYYPAPNKNGFQVVDEESIVNSPIVVSVFSYKNIEEFVEKYVKPSIRESKKQQKKKKGK